MSREKNSIREWVLAGPKTPQFTNAITSWMERLGSDGRGAKGVKGGGKSSKRIVISRACAARPTGAPDAGISAFCSQDFNLGYYPAPRSIQSAETSA